MGCPSRRSIRTTSYGLTRPVYSEATRRRMSEHQVRILSRFSRSRASWFSGLSSARWSVRHSVWSGGSTSAGRYCLSANG